jgi:hypothetical protein
VNWFARFRPYAEVFVETGTFRGDGVQRALDAGFEVVYSVEIDRDLASAASRRFADDPRVQVLSGMSEHFVAMICAVVREPVVFFLDAHWSGFGEETPLPLLEELKSISRRKFSDVVIIDDMRLMGKKSWSGEDGTDWPRAEFDFREASLEAITEACPGRQEMATDIDRLIIWRDGAKS